MLKDRLDDVKKMRPGRITLHAKDKEPIKDNNSRFVHYLFERHEKTMHLSSESLLLGKRTTEDIVSISIPR